MKLVYSREGGLFAQVVQTRIDTIDLPANLRAVIEAVLANPASYASGPVNTNLRDGYRYRLDVRKGRKKISLTFDDLALPDDVQPLIRFLQERTGKP